MNHLLFIGFGGAIGSIARYQLTVLSQLCLGKSFPYGTLIVNVMGSLFIGLMSKVLIKHSNPTQVELFRSLLLIGFAGGFTTFSAFSLETLLLLREGQVGLAMTNIGISVGLCLFAVWLGVYLGEKF